MNAMMPINSLSLEVLLSPHFEHVPSTASMSIDTRVLSAGDVFLAYPVGNAQQKSDNRVYIPTALNLGVSLVLYDPDGLNIELQKSCEDQRCIAVKNLAVHAGSIAAQWYGKPSDAMRVIGITGTNGKTTVSQWLASALNSKKSPSAVIGTLGAGLINEAVSTGFTTPDAPQLQSILKTIQDQGAKSVAMEVSSHALDQGRVNGVTMDTVVFTNLSQDHLDYHASMKDYANTKKKIFDLPGVRHAVVNADDLVGQECLTELSKKMLTSDLTVWAYATQAQSLLSLPCFANAKLKKILAADIQLSQGGMSFDLIINGQNIGRTETQFVGAFNVSNSLAIVACLMAGGLSGEQAQRAIEQLKPVSGRMELVLGTSNESPMAIVDFAHTPDALEQVLKTLRVLAKERQGDLWCVFGCGGDRDQTKRPLMGRIAESQATHVMVTSDNPRSEDPQKIINDILSGFEQPEKAQVNLDRATAILQVVRQAKPEDIVLIAGKGHEETQEIAGKKLPFSDVVHVRLAMGGSAR